MLVALSVAAAPTMSCRYRGRGTNEASADASSATKPSAVTGPTKPPLEFARLSALAVDHEGRLEIAVLRHEESHPLKPRAYEIQVYDATTFARIVAVPLGVHAPINAWAYVNDRFIFGGDELKITVAKLVGGTASTEEHAVKDTVNQICTGPNDQLLAVLRDFSGSSYDPRTGLFSDVPSTLRAQPRWCVMLGERGLPCARSPAASVCVFSPLAEDVAKYPSAPSAFADLPPDERWIIPGVVQQWRTRSTSGEIVLGFTAPGASQPLALGVDRAKEAVLWRRDLPTGSLSSPTTGFRFAGLVDDIVVAVHRCTPEGSTSEADRFFAIDSKGLVLWRSDEPTTDYGPLLVAGRVVLRRDSGLVALDARTGTVVGEIR